ncbi:hypothetical protein G6F18_006823 [Rhizopus arrhizus]|nr:hypothetical protein G6F18_006823 [Rhizopus arrhizus]
MVESIKVLRSMKGDVALWKLSVDFFTLLEVVLTLMMVQLSKEGSLGNRFKYHADGKIRIRADKKLLIPEVVSSFDQVTQDKIGLDDLKAIHWTLMPPEPGVYIMTKEQRANIPVDIRNMADELELLRETLNCVEELQKEYRVLLQEATSDNMQKSTETLLSTIVNPSIAADLHSGVFGGTVHEPMTDLFAIMSKLVDVKGKILIPGIYDQVRELTDSEQRIYDDLSFQMEELHSAVGNKTNIHETVRETLQCRWRNPSLSLHGVEGAFYNPGDKTVIPACVTGKFSIRTVPDMKPQEISELVCKYVKEEFAKLGSKNTLDIHCTHDGNYWLSSPDHPNYVAAAKAVETVYNVKPDLTREGGSIPVTLSFQDALKKNVLLLPMGRGDDGAHSINEKLDRSNYVKGTQLLGAYLYEVSKIQL